MPNKLHLLLSDSAGDNEHGRASRVARALVHNCRMRLERKIKLRHGEQSLEGVDIASPWRSNAPLRARSMRDCLDRVAPDQNLRFSVRKKHRADAAVALALCSQP